MAANKPWTTPEQARLAAAYEKHDISELLSMFPGRSRDSIWQRARLLGLTANRAWVADEDEIIRRLFPAGGVRACRDGLSHRTTSAILKRASNLGVEKQGGRQRVARMRQAVLLLRERVEECYV
ncbi:hypothetical protein M8A51_25625 [Schlegelella sp. S2-27]|uniref:Homeodomain-like domain-containing protein n=1 Tax=Caldimonas mangrovi TaxID=2944811 RepID=A0ABT0YVZ3_9BURK|nr:hypothetical protein [Caldimonas mangrovi]MCM5682917.1 hypothetical protein [Caldimonas mangrovi]